MAGALQIRVYALKSYAKSSPVAGAVPVNEEEAQKGSGGVVNPDLLMELTRETGLKQRLLDPYTGEIRSATMHSRSLDFLVARYISIGCHTRDLGSHYKDALSQIQRNMEDFTTQKRAGDSKVNDFKFYGQGFFTVEQNTVFIELPTEPGAPSPSGTPEMGWSGLVLNDASGETASYPPWGTDNSRLGNAVFFPLDVRDFSRQTDGRSGHVLPRYPNPFNPHVKQQTTIYKDTCISTSALHFAADLLTTSALSWNQFLTFLRVTLLQNLAQIDGTPSSGEDINIDNAAEDLRLLNQSRAHLADAMDYFDEILLFWKTTLEIARTGDSSSASPPVDLSLVLSDFQSLRDRATTVSGLFKEKIDAIGTNLSLQTSQQALLEDRRMKLVSYLGASYAAIALSSSILSMNVEGIGGSVPKFVFFVLTLGIILVTIVGVYLWDRCGVYLIEFVKRCPLLLFEYVKDASRWVIRMLGRVFTG